MISIKSLNRLYEVDQMFVYILKWLRFHRGYSDFKISCYSYCMFYLGCLAKAACYFKCQNPMRLILGHIGEYID